MADFGQAGKITVRGMRREIVRLHPNEGQYLYFKLTVRGGTPIFNFLRDNLRLIREESFSGHPKQVYQWTLGRKTTPTDPDEEMLTVNTENDDHMYLVGMNFANTVEYTLLVEHRDAEDNVIRVLKDMDFESNNSLDFFRELLEVRV